MSDRRGGEDEREEHERKRLHGWSPAPRPRRVGDSHTQAPVPPGGWQEHRRALDALFFQQDDFYPRGSKAYDEFWDFLNKYEELRRRRAPARPPPPHDPSSSDNNDIRPSQLLDIPAHYSRRYKLNFSLLCASDRPSHHCASLLEAELNEFREILRLFEDFRQKRSLEKLKKLFADRASLPISPLEGSIVEAVRKNQVVVVAGDTGCGKSTQVPQFLLRAGFKSIACTQPRRISAISLCRRVAYETLNEYGTRVAYQIRFDTNRTLNTRILFLTEGLLLRQVQSDPVLERYDVILVDEVHERHLTGDFLLGILKMILLRRPDLKIVLMSATINVELFSSYFGGCPIIQVAGRLHPITVEYIETDEASLGDEELLREAVKRQQDEEGEQIRSNIPAAKRRGAFNVKPYIRIMERIDREINRNERGDLLVFLPGLREILTVADAARQYAQYSKRWMILPLHSTLSVEEQDKVFDLPPEGMRKVILSTNIAETSITIDGIRFVIDSGKVKEMGYDPQTHMQSLQEFWISKASAEQRKGRAGRTGPGHCFCLYSRAEFNHFLDFAVPEIQRTPLESVVLQIKANGLGDARVFPFLEPPPAQSIDHAVFNLQQHDALENDAKESVTQLGSVLAHLPVDVSIGKMLVMGAIFGLVDPVVTMAAALSVQSPFTRAASGDETGMATARQDFYSVDGDPFTLLHIFDEWIQVKTDRRPRAEPSRAWCRRYGLEEQRLYEMVKLKRQFLELLVDAQLVEQPKEDQRLERRVDPELKWKRSELRAMQRERDRDRGKRRLRPDGELEGEDIEERDQTVDLRELDFFLSHDVDRLQKTSQKRRGGSLSRRDISLIKIIVCCGLYPRIALSDESNTLRRESEHLYHTPFKPFVFLHPTCCFQGNLGAGGIPPNELLAFVQLLETNKPYLTNVFRVPAFPILLLLSMSLDTSSDLTRVLVDDWVQIRFSNCVAAERVLCTVVILRQNLRAFVSARLAPQTAIPPCEEKRELAESLPECGRRLVEAATRRQPSVWSTRKLIHSLVDFLENKQAAAHKICRLRESEIIAEYGLSVDGSTTEKQTREAESNVDAMKTLEEGCVLRSQEWMSRKGGTQVTDYLRYGSLGDGGRVLPVGMTAHLAKHWTCPTCAHKMIGTADEIRNHLATHTMPTTSSSSSSPPPPPPPPAAAAPAAAAAVVVVHDKNDDFSTSTPINGGLRRRYPCEDCDRVFLFTPAEILRHRAGHRG